jgi:hypothetical protein
LSSVFGFAVGGGTSFPDSWANQQVFRKRVPPSGDRGLWGIFEIAGVMSGRARQKNTCLVRDRKRFC